MKKSIVFENIVDEIGRGAMLPTTPYCLMSFNPRSTVSLDAFLKLGYTSAVNEDIAHFYEVESMGDIAFYLVCRGRGSLDWILEDMTYDVLSIGEMISFMLVVGAKSIIFPFPFRDKGALYSIAKIAMQNSIVLYYLTEEKEKYTYLGYNKIDITEDIKNKIEYHINYGQVFQEYLL